MSSICLSLAPNLRCQGLTSSEAVGLIIPPLVEVVFSLGLIVIKRGSGLRKEYLLSFEGLVYFFLALLDLLSHNAASIRDSLPNFKALDIFIGISSTFPLALYMCYLFLLATKDLIPSLPVRFQSVARYVLLCHIPMILVFNLVGSFATLTYRFVEFSHHSKSIGVKYTETGIQMFFNTFTLVLFMSYQALCFCMCFYRLVHAMVDQRRIDVTAQGNDNERHLFHGTAWLALGIKLGAVETVVGFATGDFGLSLTRRILRFVGRACLIIGVIKGLDAVVDFQFVKADEIKRRPRRSVLLGLISDPKSETFHQIGGFQYEQTTEPPAAVTRSRTISRIPSPLELDSPTPSSTYASPSKSAYTASPSPFPATPYTAPSVRPPAPVLTLDTRSASPASMDRVLIQYEHGRAPTLYLRRFSDLDVPAPHKTPSTAALGEGHSPELKTTTLPDDDYPPPSSMRTPATSMSYAFSFATQRSAPHTRYTIGGTGDLPRRSKSSGASSTATGRGTASRKSTQTVASRTDTLELLHALATEFPGVPRMPGPDPMSAAAVSIAPSLGDESDTATVVDDHDSLSRSASERTITSTTGLMRRGSSTRRKAVPKFDEDPPLEKDEYEQAQVTAPASAPVQEFIHQAPAGPRAMLRLPSNPKPRARREAAMRAKEQQMQEPVPPMPAPMPPPTAHSDNGSALEFPWVQPGGDVLEDGKAELEEAWRKSAPAGTRIKSVGRAPRRWTPTPAQSEGTRESVVAEWHDTRDGVQLVFPTPPLSAVGGGMGTETV